MRILVALYLFVIAAGCGPHKSLKISVINPADSSRADQPAVLSRAWIDSFSGKSCECMIPVIEDSNFVLIPSQCDDINKDGKWDELAFVISLRPKEEKILSLRWVKKEKAPKYKMRTNIRFALIDNGNYNETFSAVRLKGTDTRYTSTILQMEGPAWENDKVGFRNYFDERSGMDIFGKITPDMVLDSVGINASYHEMQPWGMDILKVGNSLGAGSIALLIGDSLYRVGPGCKGTYELLFEGPVRSSLRLGYSEWKINDRNYSITHDITIWAGSYGYENSVSVAGAKGDESLVLGIVNKDTDSLMITHYNNRFVSLITHDRQSISGEFLGMSLLLNAVDFKNADSTSRTKGEIIETFYAQLHLPMDQPVFYSFFAGWEKTDSLFASKEQFLGLLSYQSYLRSKPVIIHIKN